MWLNAINNINILQEKMPLRSPSGRICILNWKPCTGPFTPQQDGISISSMCEPQLSGLTTWNIMVRGGADRQRWEGRVQLVSPWPGQRWLRPGWWEGTLHHADIDTHHPMHVRRPQKLDHYLIGRNAGRYWCFTCICMDYLKEQYL